MKLIEVRRIWDRAPHNALTDLIRFRGQWFCAFREAKTHFSSDGALRIIRSADGAKWESAALIASPDSDLRDPKLAITPDGQLMLSGAEALHDKSRHTHQSLIWRSDDGCAWDKKLRVGDPDFWLWRHTWHKGKAYAIGYACEDASWVRLYRSDDGRRFAPLVNRLFDVGAPNESSIIFDGDTALCLLRRDGDPNTGLLGRAAPPYTEWQWRDLGVRVGGPHMLLLPDRRIVAAVRLHDGAIRTTLCGIDPESARLTELLELPSGGDTSYAGLAFHDGELWISYYSTHEDKTAVYLARVELD